MRLARLHAVTLLVLALAGGGCGGSSSKTTVESASTATTAKNQPPPPKHVSGLAKPIFARCEVKRFNKPVTVPLVASNGTQYWRVLYQIPVTAPRVGDLPTQLTIVEESPSYPRGTLTGGHDVTIAGRNVNLRPGQAKTPANVAQWKTKTAKYI